MEPPPNNERNFENRLRFEKFTITAMSLVVYFLEHSVVKIFSKQLLNVPGTWRGWVLKRVPRYPVRPSPALKGQWT